MRNHNNSVALGAHYGYGGFVSVNGEQDSAGRVPLGVDRETDEGVLLLRTHSDSTDTPDNMMTLTKLGKGDPPEYRAPEDGNTKEKGERS